MFLGVLTWEGDEVRNTMKEILPFCQTETVPFRSECTRRGLCNA